MSELQDPNNPSGPLEIGDLIVEVDRDACIGVGACIGVAEKTWDLDDEGKAVVLVSADEETKDDIVESARACPVDAIIIKDKKTGGQIYP